MLCTRETLPLDRSNPRTGENSRLEEVTGFCRPFTKSTRAPYRSHFLSFHATRESLMTTTTGSNGKGGEEPRREERRFTARQTRANWLPVLPFSRQRAATAPLPPRTGTTHVSFPLDSCLLVRPTVRRMAVLRLSTPCAPPALFATLFTPTRLTVASRLTASDRSMVKGKSGKPPHVDEKNVRKKIFLWRVILIKREGISMEAGGMIRDWELKGKNSDRLIVILSTFPKNSQLSANLLQNKHS